MLRTSSITRLPKTVSISMIILSGSVALFLFIRAELTPLFSITGNFMLKKNRLGIYLRNLHIPALSGLRLLNPYFLVSIEFKIVFVFVFF